MLIKKTNLIKTLVLASIVITGATNVSAKKRGTNVDPEKQSTIATLTCMLFNVGCEQPQPSDTDKDKSSGN